MPELDELFRNQEFFIISLFSIVHTSVLRVQFFLQFLFDIFPLRAGFVKPHFFEDPNPGCQNLADPMDPDPKHCFKLNIACFSPYYLSWKFA